MEEKPENKIDIWFDSLSDEAMAKIWEVVKRIRTGVDLQGNHLVDIGLVTKGNSQQINERETILNRLGKLEVIKFELPPAILYLKKVKNLISLILLLLLVSVFCYFLITFFPPARRAVTSILLFLPMVIFIILAANNWISRKIVVEPVFYHLESKFKNSFKSKESSSSGQKFNATNKQTAQQFTISVRDREIWINDYLISKPHAVGVNYEFFDYIRNQPINVSIIRNKIQPEGGGANIKEQIGEKSFIKILNDLGFKGEILKAFFYNRSKDSLTYRGDVITKDDLLQAGINLPLLLQELKVAHTKNSPN